MYKLFQKLLKRARVKYGILKITSNLKWIFTDRINNVTFFKLFIESKLFNVLKVHLNYFSKYQHNTVATTFFNLERKRSYLCKKSKTM